MTTNSSLLRSFDPAAVDPARPATTVSWKRALAYSGWTLVVFYAFGLLAMIAGLPVRHDGHLLLACGIGAAFEYWRRDRARTAERAAAEWGADGDGEDLPVGRPAGARARRLSH